MALYYVLFNYRTSLNSKYFVNFLTDYPPYKRYIMWSRRMNYLYIYWRFFKKLFLWAIETHYNIIAYVVHIGFVIIVIAQGVRMMKVCFNRTHICVSYHVTFSHKNWCTLCSGRANKSSVNTDVYKTNYLGFAFYFSARRITPNIKNPIFALRWTRQKTFNLENCW